MQLTYFLARLLRLFFVIVSASMLARKQAVIEIANTLIQNRSTLFIFEVLGVVGGLAMVLGHNVWSKDVLPFIVTLVGWATLESEVASCSLSRPRLYSDS